MSVVAVRPSSRTMLRASLCAAGLALTSLASSCGPQPALPASALPPLVSKVELRTVRAEYHPAEEQEADPAEADDELADAAREALDEADAAMQVGDYDHALERVLPFFDRALRSESEARAIGSGSFLGRLLMLHAKHPRATNAAQLRRTNLEEIVVAGAANKVQLLAFLALDRWLGPPDRTIEVFDALRRSGSKGEAASRELFKLIHAKLFAAKRYEAWAEQTETVLDLVGEGEFDLGVQLYFALLATGDGARARSVADRLLAITSDGGTFATLIQEAARAGARDEARRLAHRALRETPAEERSLVLKAMASIPH